jgi:hypothetical protein
MKCANCSDFATGELTEKKQSFWTELTELTE